MFWLREVAGWALVVVALYFMYLAMDFLMDLQTPRVIEAGVMVLAGLGVLKAGTLLIRISTAVRICRSDRE